MSMAVNPILQHFASAEVRSVFEMVALNSNKRGMERIRKPRLEQ